MHMTTTTPTLRHSALPKLQQCPRFQGAETTSDAAARGTVLDAAYRDLLVGLTEKWDRLEPEDKANVLWAVDISHILSDGEDNIISEEKYLKNRVPHFDHVGTEDARILSRNMTIDLKTGQIRDYEAQMAAYALGNCLEHDVDEWECVLIFCDQRKVVRRKFTRGEAGTLVQEIVQEATNPNAKPRACEYCSWCKHQDACPEVVGPAVEQLDLVEGGYTLSELRESICGDPVRLGSFLAAFKVFEKEVADKCKDFARETLESGGTVDGWKIQKQAGNESFPVSEAVRIAGVLGIEETLNVLISNVSAKKYRELCAMAKIEPDDSKSERNGVIVKLVADKKKK